MELDRDITGYRNGRVGLYAVDSMGRELSHNADEYFPLASTVKLPIAVEAYRQVHSGRISADKKIKLTSRRKSPESGTLHKFKGEYNFLLSDLVYEMMVNSDNTATDMVLELVGFDNVRRLTEPYEMDIVMGMRPWCLFTAGYSSEFRDMNAEQIETAWRAKSYKEKQESVKRVLRENRNMPFKVLLESYGSKADEKGIGNVLENFATPRQMTRFVSDLYQDKFGAGVKEYVLDAMEEAEGWIGLYLPDSAMVYSKAGSIYGAVADSGIVTATERPEWHMIMSIFIKNAQETNEAGIAMSKMVRLCYYKILAE